MTNDISVLSLGAVTPVARKDNVNATKELQSKPPEQTASEQPRSAEAAATEKQPQREELEQSVQDLNSLVQELQRELRFSVDDGSGEMVVKVVDRQTDELVRQIPTEEILKLRERLEAATGAIFQDKA